MSSANANVLPMQPESIESFKPYRAQLAKLKNENATIIFNYESKKNEENGRSYVASLRRTKTPVNETHKSLKAASLEYGRKLDVERNEIIGELDAMIALHQERIDEVEMREKKRVQAIQDKVSEIRSMQECGGHDSVDTLYALVKLRGMTIDEATFAELYDEACAAWDKALAAQEAQHIVALKQEGDAAELEKLKAEKAARDKADYEASIAAQAAAQARADAEAEAKRKADAEADRVANEKAEIERRNAMLTLAAERAENARLQSIKDAQDVEAAAEARALRDAERARIDQAAAVEAERQRQKDDEARKASAEAKRAADQANRERVKQDIIVAMMSQLPGNAKEHAITIAEAVLAGDVPHIQVIF